MEGGGASTTPRPASTTPTWSSGTKRARARVRWSGASGRNGVGGSSQLRGGSGRRRHGEGRWSAARRQRKGRRRKGSTAHTLRRRNGSRENTTCGALRPASRTSSRTPLPTQRPEAPHSPAARTQQAQKGGGGLRAALPGRTGSTLLGLCFQVCHPRGQVRPSSPAEPLKDHHQLTARGLTPSLPWTARGEGRRGDIAEGYPKPDGS